MTLDRETVREKIITVAGELIDEGGADALKARAIAQRAGIAVGSLYNFFTDLDDLHRIINSQLMDALGAAGLQAVNEMDAAGQTDVRARLLALASAYFEFTRDNGQRWTALLAFNRARSVDQEPESYIARQEMLFGIIAETLRATSLAHDDARRMLAARALWSSVHGIVTNAYRGRDTVDHDAGAWAQVELLIDVFVTGLEQFHLSKKRSRSC